jgi:WD40 repeat protein
MLVWLTADRSGPVGLDPERLAPLLPDPHLRIRWGLSPPDTALIRVLTGHTSEVWALAWSAEGTRLASAGQDRVVRVWDPATGQQLSTLTGHPSRVRALAWSPEGTRLASASEDGEVRVWDPVTREQFSTTLTGHPSRVRVLAWSPEGTRLASADHEGEVRVWDPATGEQLCTLTGHPSRVEVLAWSPEGTRLASATNKGEIYVFDLDCPDHPIYLRVEPLTCLQWAHTGIAVGGPHGLSVLDLTHTDHRPTMG